MQGRGLRINDEWAMVVGPADLSVSGTCWIEIAVVVSGKGSTRNLVRFCPVDCQAQLGSRDFWETRPRTRILEIFKQPRSIQGLSRSI